MGDPADHGQWFDYNFLKRLKSWLAAWPNAAGMAGAAAWPEDERPRMFGRPKATGSRGWAWCLAQV